MWNSLSIRRGQGPTSRSASCSAQSGLFIIIHRVGLMQSLLALHSIGLKHGDPDERNVGIDRDGVDVTYRFFDFGCSTWHKCHGITDCEELKQQIRMLYDTQELRGTPCFFRRGPSVNTHCHSATLKMLWMGWNFSRPNGLFCA